MRAPFFANLCRSAQEKDWQSQVQSAIWWCIVKLIVEGGEVMTDRSEERQSYGTVLAGVSTKSQPLDERAAPVSAGFKSGELDERCQGAFKT